MLGHSVAPRRGPHGLGRRSRVGNAQAAKVSVLENVTTLCMQDIASRRCYSQEWRGFAHRRQYRWEPALHAFMVKAE